MARPKKESRLRCKLGAPYFKPSGTLLFQLEEIALSLDEVEALRLADGGGLHREEAALGRKGSRTVFGRKF